MVVCKGHHIFFLEKIMKRLALLLLAFAAPMFAQSVTISPVVQECGKKCSGQFSIQNGGIKPLAVTVEAARFVFKNGQRVTQPIGTTVQLSETSARIPPMSDHTFDFKVRCEELPCGVQISVIAVMGHTNDGLQIRGVLPETIYSCSAQKDCRKTFLKTGE